LVQPAQPQRLRPAGGAGQGGDVAGVQAVLLQMVAGAGAGTQRQQRAVAHDNGGHGWSVRNKRVIIPD